MNKRLLLALTIILSLTLLVTSCSSGAVITKTIFLTETRTLTTTEGQTLTEIVKQTVTAIPPTNTITATTTMTSLQTIIIPIAQDLAWLDDIKDNGDLSLFNLDGQPIAYIAYDINSTIYMWDGTPVAYLYGESTYCENRVYGYNGKHIGWFLNGILYDTEGKRVGFTKSTHPYFTSFEPFKSFKQFGFRAFRGFSKPRPLFSTVFSDIPLEDLLLSGE